MQGADWLQERQIVLEGRAQVLTEGGGSGVMAIKAQG